MSVTDDRQTTDGRAIAHSEREREFTEREFTFAKKPENHKAEGRGYQAEATTDDLRHMSRAVKERKFGVDKTDVRSC